MMKQANLGINPADLVDRISALPDSILSFILSFIPTKNAVTTSVLSKRWKLLWKTVHKLDFQLHFCDNEFCMKKRHNDCSNGWSVDEDMKFIRFVNHVLLLHDDGFLNEFHLVWKPMCIPSQVNSWISTAITRNLHDLFLCLENSDVPFEIPSSVFGCETLKSLELDGNMFVSDSIVVCLPSLERIKLVSVYFRSDEAFQKLISTCPVLNFLFIKMDMDIMTGYIQTYWDTTNKLFNFIISSTSLRSFILEVVSNSEFFEGFPYSYCSLELDAPSLEFIRLEGFVRQIFVRESLSSLVIAGLGVTSLEGDELSDANTCNSLAKAIQAFDCAKTLWLSEFFSSALSRATIGLSTNFTRLTELTIGANCCYCSSIQDIIQSSDNLEVLIVEKEPVCPHYDNHRHTHSNWTTPAEVPRCLSNNLKTVELFNYGGFDYDREMIGYMLMHGSVLEVMTIYCDIKRDDLKHELLREICDFPRKSPACKVKFR